jgi:hypothetical protein
MQFARRLFIGAGAVALVTVLLMVAAPRTVRAVVATLIRDVDNPGRASTVFARCQVNSSNADPDIDCSPAYTVPATDRLVIQQVEANCLTPQGNSIGDVFFFIKPPGNPLGVAHFLTFQDQGPDVFTNSRNFGTNQPVTYYLDPGSTLGFHADTTDFAGFTVCTFQINGYLISYP